MNVLAEEIKDPINFNEDIWLKCLHCVRFHGMISPISILVFLLGQSHGRTLIIKTSEKRWCWSCYWNCVWKLTDYPVSRVKWKFIWIQDNLYHELSRYHLTTLHEEGSGDAEISQLIHIAFHVILYFQTLVSIKNV